MSENENANRQPTEDEKARVANYKTMAAAGQIPQIVRDALKRFMDEYKLHPWDVQARFVEKLAEPFLLAQGEGKWVMAARALVADESSARFGQKTCEFEVSVVDISNPIEQKKGASAGQRTIKAFGIARSLDDETPYSGPTDISLYGFADDRMAHRFLDGIVPGKTYRIHGRLGRGTQKGPVPRGATGLVNVTASEAGLRLVENGVGWPEMWAALWAHYPACTLRELLALPKNRYLSVAVEADIHRAYAITQKKSGQQGGVMQLIDDTIMFDRLLLEKIGGSVGVFLPRNEVVNVNTFVQYARVRALIKIGTEKADLDPQGNPTGGTSAALNCLALEVLSNPAPGDTIPNPSKPAVVIPTGIAGANDPSATDF